MYPHLRARLALLVGLAAIVLATVSMVPTPADATTQLTSTGVRCTIVGTPRADVLKGTPRRDVICGGGGADRIDGRQGSDLVDGGPGNDEVIGGSGNDVVLGGPGGDKLQGGSGNDRVRGEVGDDDLSGGIGDDDVDGGPGFNLCDVPGGPGDTQARCAVDGARAVVESVSATPGVVDVSEEAQTVRVEARLTDDTGVKRAQLGPSIASLVSGTPRDGIWAASIRVPRFIEPGPRDLDLTVYDRVGRISTDTAPDVYEVVNTVVDQQMPVVESVSLSRTSVDVRTTAQSITATAHLTDDLAGPGNMFLCPAHAFPTGQPSFRQAGSCVFMQRVSGTRTDGAYEATYTVPQGAPSGTWNVEVWVDDAAGNSASDFWFGPDQYAANMSYPEPRYRAIPDGGGVFTVTGTPQDLTPPVLTSLTLSPGVVDTANGAVLVTADIAGTDVEGVTDVGMMISGYPGYPDHHTWVDTLQIAWVQDFTRISGTAQDGVWRATFVVPGGTPDGHYFIQAWLQDSTHFESWMSPGSGAGDQHPLTPELAPSGDYFVVANS